MKNIGQKLSSVLLALTLLLPFFTPSKSLAVATDPTIKEYNLAVGDFVIGEITYKNDTNKDVTANVTVSAYDAKEEKYISTEPLVNISQKTITAKKNSEVKIKYVITIPNDKPAGTYFDVVSIEPKDGQNVNNGEAQIDIKSGIGVLFVMNVTDSTTSVEKVFINKSDTKLVIENAGFPFIYPLKVKYTYQNNSNFVFKPEGEIRIIDNNGQQVTNRFPINENGDSLYPGESISIEQNIMTWTSLDQVLKSKKIVSKVYSGLDSNYITDEVTVSILPQVIAALVLALGLLIGLIAGIFILAKKFLFKKA